MRVKTPTAEDISSGFCKGLVESIWHKNVASLFFVPYRLEFAEQKRRFVGVVASVPVVRVVRVSP